MSDIRRFSGGVLLCAFVVLLVSAAGCQSSAPVVFPQGIDRVIDGGKPAWVSRYPVDSEYYIGIGSSKTGDKGEDMEIARAKALVNLASSVSTEIKSELLITAGESSDGQVYETVDQVIRETVDTNIREVEVADTYYSQTDGYWFYLRLSRSKWESIQREEAANLAARVVGIVEPVISDNSRTIIARLRALSKGWRLLAESPYSAFIETGLNGEYGVLIDLIEDRIAEYLDDLHLDISPAVIQTYPGRPVSLSASITSASEHPPGEFAIEFSFPEASDTHRKEAFRVTTDEKGLYNGSIDVPAFEPGSVRMVARADLEPVGLSPGAIPSLFISPETEAMLEVTAFTAKLTVSAPEELNVSNAFSAFGSLITSSFPIDLTEEPGPAYDISVELIVRGAPPNNFGIIVAYIKALISVKKDGKVIESYQSPEIKEGGLDLFQACARGFEKLIDSFKSTGDLTRLLESAIFI